MTPSRKSAEVAAPVGDSALFPVRLNRGSRRGLAAVHRKFCDRGRGFICRRDGKLYYPARCKSWRECEYCAWVYGLAVAERWRRVNGLVAFVVLTMPPGRRDWRSRDDVRAMMTAWRKLLERMQRKFGRRFKLLWSKEHAGAGGGLHLNVLWDGVWVDQSWLSAAAAECGFGRIVDISRIGARGRHARLSSGYGRGRSARTYALKSFFHPSSGGARRASSDEAVRRYALKDLGQTADAGDDWLRYTRRWGASRAARAEMPTPMSNPDWYWSPHEPLLAGQDSPALTIELGHDRKFEPRLYPPADWLERQRKAWMPRGPDGQLLTRGPDGRFRIATD